MILIVRAAELCILDGSDMYSYVFIEPKPGECVSLYVNNSKLGFYPIDAKVVSVDEKGFSCIPYDSRAGADMEEIRIEIGKETELIAPWGDRRDPIDPDEDTTEPVRFELFPVEILWEGSSITDYRLYRKLGEKYPELVKQNLQKILENADVAVLFNIYSKGLLGVEKDPKRAFCYLLGERDYDEYKRWAALPEVQEDLRFLSDELRNGVLQQGFEGSYWNVRYRLDHKELDAYPDLVKAASWYAKHLYYDNAEQLNLFYFRDLVRYTVDYDLFDEFEAINPKYWHSLQQDKITLHMIYACYLSMIEHPIGNEYSFVELIKFDPEKEFSFVADDPFAIGHYVDDELAKAKVLLAAAEGDAYAKAIVAHGHLE